jgi:hypothetical protein
VRQSKRDTMNMPSTDKAAATRDGIYDRGNASRIDPSRACAPARTPSERAVIERCGAMAIFMGRPMGLRQLKMWVGPWLGGPAPRRAVVRSPW